jgi:hypothetical protein
MRAGLRSAVPAALAATTKCSLELGSPGGLVKGPFGDYQVSPLEVARAHGFTDEALAQVERLNDTGEQWRWVANSTPRRTVQALLSAILDSLLSPLQQRLQDGGPIPTHSEAALCAASCAANTGVPAVTATATELVTAVQRLVDAMPTRDELAALQHADPETRSLLKWIRSGRPKKAMEGLTTAWKKEARYLHLLDGVLFYRPVLNPQGDLVDVPVLPAGLRRGALMAMHHGPLMCHPAAKGRQHLAAHIGVSPEDGEVGSAPPPPPPLRRRSGFRSGGAKEARFRPHGRAPTGAGRAGRGDPKTVR